MAYQQQQVPEQGYLQQQQQQQQQHQHQHQHQPIQPIQPMQSMQPAEAMHPQYAQGQNVQSQDWQNSLMDCSPCDSCLLGTFLPCLLLGQTSERLRDPSMQTYEPINSDCLLMAGITYLTGCGWIYAMMKRSEIRERYGIKGGGMSDCCSSYYCACCVLIQQEKEVKARTASGPIVQAYVSPKGGMQMPQ